MACATELKPNCNTYDLLFNVGQTYRINIKGDDYYVDAVFTENTTYNIPDNDPEEMAEEDDIIVTSGYGHIIANDYETYSLRIFPKGKKLHFPICFGTKIFVFERLLPNDAFSTSYNYIDGSNILFDNYNHFHRSRRTRCVWSNTVHIPVDAYDFLEFRELKDINPKTKNSLTLSLFYCEIHDNGQLIQGEIYHLSNNTNMCHSQKCCSKNWINKGVIEYDGINVKVISDVITDYSSYRGKFEFYMYKKSYNNKKCETIIIDENSPLANWFD